MKNKLLIIILSILLCTPTLAFATGNMINIDDIPGSFEKTKTIGTFDQMLDSKTTMTVNKTGKTLDVSVDGEITTKIKYTDNYVELDNRSETANSVVFEEKLVETMHVLALTEAVINLSGFEGKFLKDDAKPNDFNKYGMQFETEESVITTEENGITSTTSIEYVKYFKLSLDKTKIAALIATYGEDIKEFENPFINDLIPKITATNYTSNTVTLKIEFAKENLVSQYPVYADIYRSTEIDGEYTKINDEKINYAEKNAIFIDGSVEGNKTYYYKAIMTEANKESEIITVTTAGITTNQNEKNPKTGIASYTGLFIVSVIFASVFVLTKRNSLFKNI